MIRFLPRGVATTLLLTAVPALSHAAAPTDACAALLGHKVPGAVVVMQKAQLLPAGKAPAAPTGGPPGPDLMLPAHCRVEGVIDPHNGLDGKPYAITFAIAMPEKWNGRFLFQGGGGLNGALNPPVGSAAAGAEPALSRGFAVVSTDSGHKGTTFDASFFADQEASLNFLYLSVGKVTVVAKDVVTAYYKKPPAHSYFMGCSTGGREAMIVSQRYPGYFDGIVAGAPAMRTRYSNLATSWVTTSLNAAAPKDADGKAQTAKALSDADRKLVVDGLLKACDGQDGAEDGMVFNVRGCAFDPATLACSGEKTDACLSPVQVASIKKGFAGPKTSAGAQVYPGFYFDTGITASGQGIPGLLVTGMSPVGPSPTGTTMDVDAEAHAAALDAVAMAGDSNAWTNLSGYTAHGGKLIFYHGVSDPWFSARDTVEYYERLGKDNPSRKREDWSRLFLVPGMGHCRGGAATLDSFDMVDAIVNWVEKNQAPEKVIATGRAFPGRSRPLCPYPQHPQYNGSGDKESAASFHCTE